MTQRAIRSLADVNVQKKEVANPLHLHGEMYIPVKAIQMVKKLV
jgi:hypothetical protein